MEASSQVADGNTGSSLPWVVLKFGGTSVATAAKWNEIVRQLKRVRASGRKCWLVVSAVTKVTNLLNEAVLETLNFSTAGDKLVNLAEFTCAAYEQIVAIHRKLWTELSLSYDDQTYEFLAKLLLELKRMLVGIALCGEASPRLRARVSSFGEMMSSYVGLQVLRRNGFANAVRVDSRKFLVARHGNDSNVNEEDKYLSACVNPSFEPELVSRLVPAESDCVIAQGFIGSTLEGDTCLLGRGGSDTSAALFAALLGADCCEIWTDVHGLFTSDPRHVEGTRLIKSTTYRVAQELASMGAKVLHPRCIVPAAWGTIPVEIHNTEDPNGPCTKISPVLNADSNDPNNGNGPAVPRVLAVTCRNGQALVHIDSVDMWGESGFLAKVFKPFRELDVSVDLVATSQYAVSLTLDYIPGGFEGSAFARVISQLKRLGTVRTRYPCSVVSIVGEHLRSALPEIGAALKALKDHGIHLMTQSCEDLNMSFVVDDDAAKSMVEKLHKHFFVAGPNVISARNSDVMGHTWEQLVKGPPTPPSMQPKPAPSAGKRPLGSDKPSSLSPVSRHKAAWLNDDEEMAHLNLNGAGVQRKWWLSKEVRSALLQLGSDGPGHYVYNEAMVLCRCTNLQKYLCGNDIASSNPALTDAHNGVIHKLYYAMKANSNLRVLELIAQSGFGMECVSIAEVRFVRQHLGKECPILFSPNFCAMSEFSDALRLGAQVIVDDISIIKQDPSIFQGRRIAFRVDPVAGEASHESHGHHKHVRTSGAGQKFGLPLSLVASALKEAKSLGAVVVGLHSHVGSGVLVPTVWRDTADTLMKVAVDENGQRRPGFEDIEWFDLGGGLGVAGQNPDAVVGVHLPSVASALQSTADTLDRMVPPIKLHMEPGRYLVSEAGALVTSVTQIRKKLNNTFVGTATGMNSLIRPALYSAWHDIVNLSQATERELEDGGQYYDDSVPTKTCHVVGPICETADVLGHSRDLPVDTKVGDVLLIANAGAYGFTMSSNYNMRTPASEVTI
jgi:bifunctional diaminopimelate decarboxylase / aspartate kinase